MTGTERVFLVIDNDNLNPTQRDFYPIDYGKLLHWLIGERQCVGATLFSSKPRALTNPDSIETNGNLSPPRYPQFVYSVQQMGWKVVEVAHKLRFDDETNQQRWRGYKDSHLMIYILRYHQQFDSLILVTHDGDFAEFCQVLSYMFGKRIEIAAFIPQMSFELAKVADQIHDLANGDNRKVLEYLVVEKESAGEAAIILFPTLNQQAAKQILSLALFKRFNAPFTRQDIKTLWKIDTTTVGHLADACPQAISQRTGELIGVEKAAKIIAVSRHLVYGEALKE